MKLDERNRMIQELVDDIDNWDLDALLDYARNMEQEIYDNMSPEVLQTAYNDWKENER